MQLAGFAILFLVLCGLHVDAAPSNDQCSGAMVIPGAGPFPHLTAATDITTATTFGDAVPPGEFYPSRVIRGVWFTFTPAANGSYTIASCGGAGGTATTADTVMAIYTSPAGCTGPFQALGEADDEACSPQAAITKNLLADTKYYVLVWKFCEGCTEDGLNTVQLLVTATIPPANDSCDSALPLQLNIPATGFNTGATDDYRIIPNATNFPGLDQTPTNAAGRDVVYSFTAPQAGIYSFKVSAYDPLQDVILYAASTCPAATPGAPANITPLSAANRSQVNASEQISCLALNAGQMIYLFVDDVSPGSAGSAFTVEVTRCIREEGANDSPADAKPIACGIEGSISTPGDRDFYTLGNFPPGWRAFAVVDGDAARTADFDLRITTFSDTVEYDDADNDSPFRPNSPNIAGAFLPGGPVFAFVNFKAARASEPYRLYAVVQPPLAEATPEAEPNNSIAEANFAERGYVYGTLNSGAPSTDVDVYAVNVAEGDILFLSLDGDPRRDGTPLNARLELIDPNGTIIVGVNDLNASSLDSTNLALGNLIATSPSAPGEAILYRAPAEGTLFARVSVAAGTIGSSSAGDYLLSLSRNCRAGGDGVNQAPTLNDITITQPVVVGSPAVLRGFHFDSDLADAHMLRIDWGDGTSNVIQSSIGGRVDFAVPHTYAAPTANVPVQITVTDREGLSATETLTIQVRTPLVPARFTSITPLAGNRIQMELEGAAQASYLVEYRTPSGPWQTLGRHTAGANGRFSIEDTTPTDVSRFYRATAE